MTGPSPEPTPPTRAIELSVEVPGSPQEVWDAIATGPGVTSWFIPFQIEQREGGRVAMDFGSYGTEEARVTAWEPPHRFAYQGPDDGSIAYEWLVEARDGGSCVVRLVNSGFGHGEGWEDQYDGMTEGWKIFLHMLRLHLVHRRGRPATRAVIPTVSLTGPNRAAWDELCRAVGVPADLAEGDAFTATADGAPPLAGRVEVVVSSPAATARCFTLDQPAPGTGFLAVEGDGDHVAGSLYLYLSGEGADAGQGWAGWLTDRFPPPPPPPAEPPPAGDPPSAAP